MSKNYWEVGGFVGRDPEAKQTSNGKTLATCSLSVYKNKEKNYWIQMKAFGDKAENLMRVKKGDRVVVEGRHDYDEWEKDGQKRTSVCIWVDKVNIIPREKRVDESTPF